MKLLKTLKIYQELMIENIAAKKKNSVTCHVYKIHIKGQLNHV